MSTYLPTREGELKDFALNFAALVKVEPINYALTAGDATQIDNAVQVYASAYDALQSPVTCTDAALVTKDNAKTTLMAILRGYAMQIKNNQSVSDEAKTNLRIGVYDVTRTPVPTPITFPVLKLMGATPLRHELRWNDSGEPDRKGRPAGTIGLQLFVHVADAPPADPLASRFRGFTTKQPYRMAFDVADKGRTAYYYARWQTATGLVSQLSQPVSMTVAG